MRYADFWLTAFYADAVAAVRRDRALATLEAFKSAAFGPAVVSAGAPYFWPSYRVTPASAPRSAP